MSRIKTIFALIAVVLVAVFAVQNHAPVDIRFLMYSVSVSHALVIVISVAVGVIVGLIVGLNSSFQAARNAKALNKNQVELQQNVSSVESENQRLLGKIDELNAQIATLEARLENATFVSTADFNDSIDSMDI